MNVLIVDDDSGFLSATSRLLEILSHNVVTANSVSAAQYMLSREDIVFDRILIDLMLPDGNGLELLDPSAKHNADVKVTIITGNSAVKSLVKSLYGPNINYLIKPITLENIKSLFDQSVSVKPKSQTREHRQFHFGGLIGESQVMKELYEKIARVAKTRANVMLFGESGVGKEVVANAIHFVSQNEGELVAANCGAFSKELIGSELFGHEKGAFTGAIAQKTGLFEAAHKGSVFLDEITEMPIEMQPNLLRVLETSQIKRVGGAKLIDFEARVISATNRKEGDLIREKVLREDLYFRLAVFPIHIPALRERKEDIPALSHYFLGELNKQNDTQFELSPEALSRLHGHDWPGNVRELRHFIHRAFIMTPPEDKYITIDKVTSPFQAASANSSNVASCDTQDSHESDSTGQIIPGRTIDEVEKELIEATLEFTGGDKQRSAEMLGISLKTLYNRLKSYK